MTKDLATVSGRSTVTPERPTKKELLESIARMFDGKGGRIYKRVPNVRLEHLSDAQLRLVATTGTVLDPVVATLNAMGISTAPNAGDVKAKLSLEPDDMHEFACSCLGSNITAENAAAHFRGLASNEE